MPGSYFAYAPLTRVYLISERPLGSITKNFYKESNMHTVCKFIGLPALLFVIVLNCQARFCISAGEIDGKININTATEAQIALLPGIGPKLAAEIVSHRTSNGGFKTVEEIKTINGIGDKKFEKIKDFITVEGDTTIKSTKGEKGEKEQKS